MNIHLWFPNIFEFKGGIQVYSTNLLYALQKNLLDYRYRVFLKHDTRAKPAFVGLKTDYHCTGLYPLRFRTFFFASQVLLFGIFKRPSLVIATHLNFTQAAYWLNKITQVPYWAIAHGVEAWDIQSPGLQRALQQADLILSVSNYTRDRLLTEQSLDPKKIGLLPNTVDHQQFQIDSKPEYLLDRYGLSAQQPIILTVARLDRTEQYKGYDQILRALPTVRNRISDVHYILVGQGNDQPRIEALIQTLKLQDCVTLTGFVPDEELCDHYNLCDLFAMPSKGEGFGIVYLEALACGKPTLGGNQDGAIDALANGELGVLVNPDDVDAIAQTLTQILQKTHPHPLLYQPHALRQKVIEYFGFEQFQKTLVTLLEKHLVSE